MSRILFVSTSTTVGGAEKTVYSLATLLDPARFEVCGVVSVKPLGAYGQRLRAQGVEARSLATAGRPGLAEVRALRRVIAQHRPDIVHAFMYQAIQLCRMARRNSPVPFLLVSSPRVNYRSRSWPTLLIDRLLKSQDDLLIAECEASRRYLTQRLGYEPRKVKAIYNGVDLAQWPVSRLERQKKRLELRVPAGDLLVGAVGRLDEQKGHEVLIEAMRLLRGRVPARCAILGSGPRREELKALIRRHELEDRVWLLGEQDDVASWLSAFDIFALPSLWEGLPNALLEAMALGLPCVASAVDGVPEAIEDRKSGLLVSPQSPKALAEALSVLVADENLRARLGEGARKTIAERFKLIDMIASYQTVYESLAGR